MKKIIPLVSAILLGLIGFVGWRYGQARYAPAEPPKPQPTLLADAGNDAPPVDSSQDDTYFAVADWKVRFPIPKELRGDLLSHESNSKASGSIIFASKHVNSLTGDTSCALVKQPDGGYAGGIQASLVRIDPHAYPPDSLEVYKRQLTYLKEIKGYQYYARKQTRDPPVTCLTGHHENYSAIEQTITDQLNEAFRHLEPLN